MRGLEGGDAAPQDSSNDTRNRKNHRLSKFTQIRLALNLSVEGDSDKNSAHDTERGQELQEVR